MSHRRPTQYCMPHFLKYELILHVSETYMYYAQNEDTIESYPDGNKCPHAHYLP